MRSPMARFADGIGVPEGNVIWVRRPRRGGTAAVFRPASLRDSAAKLGLVRPNGS